MSKNTINIKVSSVIAAKLVKAQLVSEGKDILEFALEFMACNDNSIASAFISQALGEVPEFHKDFALNIPFRGIRYNEVCEITVTEFNPMKISNPYRIEYKREDRDYKENDWCSETELLKYVQKFQSRLQEAEQNQVL